jgi:DNA adenine methylase
MAVGAAGGLLDRAQAAVEKALGDLPLGDFGVQVHLEIVGEELARVGAEVLKQSVRICKADANGEERYVLGVVLEPQDPDHLRDSQGDVYTAETIRQTAYLFMEEYRNIGLQHSGLINDQVKILESWIQREDTTIGGQTVKAGTWLMAVRVLDDELWAAVKDGRITGFSIGGTAIRTPLS